jgi:Flp pilus assembly pilin Flp
MMKHIKNEKGIALVMVLILALIALAIVATLVYLSTQGTKFSGAYKRYETAREAGVGGAEIAAALIKSRGDIAITGLTINSLTCDFNLCNCGEPEDHTDNVDSAGNRTCCCDKICSPAYTGVTYNWLASCGADGTSLDPFLGYDMEFTLDGLGSNDYRVTAKIVNTSLGNSDLSGEELGGTSVVNSTAGVIPTPPVPYMYRIEINSQNSATVLERSRLSVLYAY